MSKVNLNHYYSVERPDLLAFIPGASNTILDVGCATGKLGGSLKQRQGCKVVGLEADPQMAQEARQRLDEVIVGDVEKMELPFESASFDCVIYADILEHLYNPWGLVEGQRKYLKPTGKVVASIPNIQNFRVVVNLLRGKWEYTEAGIMDSTHLRFFTRREIYKLFSNAGYKNIAINLAPLPEHRIAWWKLLLRKFLPNFFAHQYYVVAEK